jgi:streptogramin lyase
VLYDVGGYGTDEASLELPVDIAVDRDQSLLVLDRGRGALLAFDRAGRFLGQRLFQGAAADEAREPGARLLLDRLGKLWLLSAHERDLVPLDDVLEPARTSRFLVPEDSLRAPLVAASSPDGDLWVYDAGRAAVLRFDPSGRLQSTVASACVTDLAVDAAGFLYAASATSQSVSAYGSRIEGSARTLRLFGGDKISWRPAALAVGPGRRVAVADPDRDEIQMLAPEPRP